jgi:lactose/L-arabinose transport system permease protein
MRLSGFSGKSNFHGVFFIVPASLFICILSFFPMIKAFTLSVQSGLGNNLRFTGIWNYYRLFHDDTFFSSLGNAFIYLVVQVPIMLFVALILASILNYSGLKCKGFFRTIIFLPCTTALISSAMIFKTFFSINGVVNFLLLRSGFLEEPISWLTHPVWAKVVIILVITWRWTGYNTIFYLAGLQNIDINVYEAARIDGADSTRQFFWVTLPILKPVIILTTIMSTTGTLQLFDEVKNLTGGGPGYVTITISQYIYNLSFFYNPQFGYAAAVSYIVLLIVAFLSFFQIRMGDR